MQAQAQLDCLDLLKTGKIGKSLGKGNAGWVFSVKNLEGQTFAVKVYLEKSDLSKTKTPSRTGLASALFAQSLLSRVEYAPRLLGLEEDQTVLAEWSQRFPERYRTAFSHQGRIALVAVSEFVSNAIVLQDVRNQKADRFAKIAASLKPHRQALLSQVVEIENLLSQAQVVPYDDQALVVFSSEGPKIQMIDFDLFEADRNADFTLHNIRSQLDYFTGR